MVVVPPVFVLVLAAAVVLDGFDLPKYCCLAVVVPEAFTLPPFLEP